MGAGGEGGVRDSIMVLRYVSTWIQLLLLLLQCSRITELACTVWIWLYGIVHSQISVLVCTYKKKNLLKSQIKQISQLTELQWLPVYLAWRMFMKAVYANLLLRRLVPHRWPDCHKISWTERIGTVETD